MACDFGVLILQPAQGLAVLPLSLKEFFSASDTIKVGVGIHNDLRVLRAQFPNDDFGGFQCLTDDTSNFGFPSANGDGSHGSNPPSLVFLARYFLGVQVEEDNDMPTSFQVHRDALSRRQWEYAARDAFLCFDLHCQLARIHKNDQEDRFVRAALVVGPAAHTPVDDLSPDDRNLVCTFDDCYDTADAQQTGVKVCSVAHCGGKAHLRCFTAAAGNNTTQPFTCGDCFIAEPIIWAPPIHAIVDLPDRMLGGGAHQPLSQQLGSGRDQRAETRGWKDRADRRGAGSSSESSAGSRDSRGRRSRRKKQTRRGACAAEKWAAKEGHQGGKSIKTFFSSDSQRSRPTPRQKRTERTQEDAEMRGASDADSPCASTRGGSEWSGDASEGAMERAGARAGTRAPAPLGRGRAGTVDSPGRDSGDMARSRSGDGQDGEDPATLGPPRRAPHGAQGAPPLH
jgi:hypothetical protein